MCGLTSYAIICISWSMFSINYLYNGHAIWSPVPNFNTVSQPMSSNNGKAGQFDEHLIQQFFSVSEITFLLITTIEYFLLCYSIYVQWNIEKEYSLRTELMLITLLWFVCKCGVNLNYVFDVSIFGQRSGKLTLRDLHWFDFAFTSFRSIMSICITCIKSIYDSY